MGQTSRQRRGGPSAPGAESGDVIVAWKKSLVEGAGQRGKGTES